jgi:hypothetical protein
MNNQQLNTVVAYPRMYIDLMVKAENCLSRKDAIDIIHTATKVLTNERNTHLPMD